MAGRHYRVACLTGSGTAPELMAEASRALQAVARLHGLRIEQTHLPFGADARMRGGQALPHAARAACLGADAVLVADGEDEPLTELRAELDLRARQTRVRFGTRSDLVLLSPVAEESAAWTLERAFALARSRRGRLSVVADGAEWQRAVAGTAERHPGVRVDLLDRGAAPAAAAFDAESFDVLVADHTLGEVLASLVGASAMPPRVAASGYLAEHGPSLFTPLDTGTAIDAGHGATDPSSMLLAAAMLLGDGLGERCAADTLVGALAGALGDGISTVDRLRRGVAATTREFTDSVLAGFQVAFTNAEFHPGVLS